MISSAVGRDCSPLSEMLTTWGNRLPSATDGPQAWTGMLRNRLSHFSLLKTRLRVCTDLVGEYSPHASRKARAHCVSFM
jgi:hypothetical protein